MIIIRFFENNDNYIARRAGELFETKASFLKQIFYQYHPLRSCQNILTDIHAFYNTIIPSPLSAERDNSRQLAGGNARARNSEGIIFYNTFRFRLEGV